MKKIIMLLLPLLALACTLTAAPAQTSTEAIRPAQLAQVIAPPSPTQAACTVTALKTLNLRATPGTSSAVIAILKHGDLLTILPDPAQGNWIHVQAQDRAGWINSNYCKGQQTP